MNLLTRLFRGKENYAAVLSPATSPQNNHPSSPLFKFQTPSKETQIFFRVVGKDSKEQDLYCRTISVTCKDLQIKETAYGLLNRLFPVKSSDSATLLFDMYALDKEDFQEIQKGILDAFGDLNISATWN